MQDDYRWMAAAMFDMAATCRREGMTAACNLLTESAILLHVCLAQKEKLPPGQLSAWDSDEEDTRGAASKACAASLDHNASGSKASVRMLYPVTVSQPNGRVQV
jgi:hypothetical protein